MAADGGGESSRREADLLDFAEEGNVGGTDGNVAEKRSPSLGPIDPISCEQKGNVGNVGNLFPSSREENSLSHACAPTDESAHESRIGSPENVPNVPHVPQRSAIETKDGSYVRGTFGATRA
jgi:hypothetical protein